MCFEFDNLVVNGDGKLKNEIKSGADLLIAVLASGDPGTIFDQVTIQKILFILGREAEIGTNFFKFESYNYGPFDKNIYSILDNLENKGYLEEVRNDRFSEYIVSASGHKKGHKVLENHISRKIRTYMKKLVKWAANSSFSELVSAVYNAYPETRENSIF